MFDFITPKDLERELDATQKEICDFLRKQYGRLRDRQETRWQLNIDQANAVRRKFAPRSE
ncbi:hypothetical protein [Pseudarthrobacter sulfonivorans]|uniref:hypothetical protein n=1 Tax=Pseudarthrobacter sulfonivorans TaxID=121292 RepID=UPI00277FA36C|nr:hypothetical protein [Pseudarthrobacter sulfonivorans]MDP9998399.1 hypothetical protein [Pseudarthrobacter sulfonivorans]